MIKRVLAFLIIIIVVIAILFLVPRNNNEKPANNIINENKEISDNIVVEKNVEDISMDTVYIKVNDQVLNIELEDNLATKELKEKLKNGDVVIEAHEYGGFEKVGDLGFDLPREDSNIKTSVGDIVLYQGNQISIFYGSNSWSYTKLGKVTDVSSNELKSILGDGDVTLTMTIQ